MKPTHRKKRRTKPTPKKLAAFLTHLAQTGNVTLSADMTNLERTRLYELRNTEPEFAAAWEAALDEAADLLEAEARRRAIEGVEQKKFHKDEPILDPETGEQYVERAYSDTLLIFLLKGARPEKYRERSSTELSGPGGQPLMQGMVQIYLPSNGRDQLEAPEADAVEPS